MSPPRQGHRRQRSHHLVALASLGLLLPAVGRGAVDQDGGGAPQPPSIVYGGDADFPPYEFLDERGEPAGLNVDLIRAVARERGWSVRVELRPWQEIRRRLGAGQVDVAAMYRTPGRIAEVEFAIAHELVYHEMYVRAGAPPLRALSDLAGRTVLAQADTFAAEALALLDLGATLRVVASEPEALRALAAGQGDAAVVTQAVGRPFEARGALGGSITASGPPVLLAEYAFVAPKGRHLLAEGLAQGVAAVKASGEYERLYRRWLRPDRSAGALRLVSWAAALSAVVLLLVGAWTWALRRQVAAQAAAFREEYAARQRAQAALAESERARRQAQKMEAIGRLSGGIAHDFNNILGVVMSYATFVREQLVTLRADTSDADEILAASDRATRLTRQLLSFSRATPVGTAAIDVGAVAGELTTMLRRLVGEHIQVALELPAEPVFVEADPTQIEQVLLNLAANARDAMPQGGWLRISVGHRVLTDADSRGLAPGAYAEVVVSDGGLGMDEDTVSRIFEPFFTTKAPGRGTGLGLATVFTNVQRLRGRIEVRSAPGKGSTFVVLVPACSTPPAGQEQPEPAARAPLARETILLVEDDESLRRAARAALEREGHQVVEAKDGEHAVEVAARAEALTMIVTDVVLPRRSGPALVELLRQRRGRLRVLYLSGYVGEGATLDVSAPGTAFLAKPCTPQALVEAVARLSAGAAPADAPALTPM